MNYYQSSFHPIDPREFDVHFSFYSSSLFFLFRTKMSRWWIFSKLILIMKVPSLNLSNLIMSSHLLTQMNMIEFLLIQPIEFGNKITQRKNLITLLMFSTRLTSNSLIVQSELKLPFKRSYMKAQLKLIKPGLFSIGIEKR